MTFIIVYRCEMLAIVQINTSRVMVDRKSKKDVNAKRLTNFKKHAKILNRPAQNKINSLYCKSNTKRTLALS